MKVIIVSLSFVFLLISCNNNKPISNESSESLGRSKNSLDKASDQHVINDSLIVAFETKLNKIIDQANLIIDKEAIQNRHVDNVMDTIITYKLTKNISIRTN